MIEYGSFTSFILLSFLFYFIFIFLDRKWEKTTSVKVRDQTCNLCLWDFYVDRLFLLRLFLLVQCSESSVASRRRRKKNENEVTDWKFSLWHFFVLKEKSSSSPSSLDAVLLLEWNEKWKREKKKELRLKKQKELYVLLILRYDTLSKCVLVVCLVLVTSFTHSGPHFDFRVVLLVFSFLFSFFFFFSTFFVRSVHSSELNCMQLVLQFASP